MPHSYAETLSLTCATCGRDFEAEFWLVVDTTECPDLLERIRAGTLHDLACPHCGDAGHMDAPLLLYQPDAEPAILFSPAEETTPEEDREQARQLIEALQKLLGDDWQDAWLAEGLRSAPHALLPALLSDDPEGAMARMAQQAADELERLQQEDPERFQDIEAAMRSLAKEAAPLLPLVEQFIRAETWDQSQRIVEQRPELLSEEADRLLETLIEAARIQEDDQAVQMFDEHRTLLHRCREAGIPRAFAEKMFAPEVLARAEAGGISPEELLAQAEAADQMPPELREVLAELAATGVEIRSQEDFEAALTMRPDLQAKLAAAMADTGGGINVPVEFYDDWDKTNEAQQRYLRHGDRSALDAAAAAWERILRHPNFAASDARFQLATMNDGGRIFLRSYWAAGLLSDLNRALELWQTAVQHTPPDSPNLPGYLNNLGTGLRARYARTGSLDDLAEAIRVYQTAVQRTPPDSPDLPMYLNNLGNGLRDRYARTGALADLEVAIASFETAVQRTPPDSPDLPSRLNNLGAGLRDRYVRTGALADLEEAIRVYQTAVQLTPPDSPDLPTLLNNLGAGLSDRNARSGALADLEEAIRVYQTAVQLTPPDSPDLPSRLNNLGAGLRDRYARTGALADLEEAIRVCQTAVQRTPPDSPGLPMYLTNLGNGLSDRYARTGALADLEEAIRVYQTAVQRTPPDSPGLPMYLTNLGIGLLDRYVRTGALADLEEAIRVYQTAVQRTPPDSPDLPMYLTNLGIGLLDRYVRTGALADLEEARERYRAACKRGQEVTPEEALRSARNWGNWALQRRDWQEATEAYAYGRQAIDLLFATQISRAAKESWLREAQGLPVNAAYALARLDKAKEAVVALEAGRARLLAEALEQNRRDLELLPELGHADLLARYRQAAERITLLQQQAGQTTTSPPQSTNLATYQPTNHRQEMEAARHDLDAAIAAIRQVPGYDDFFLAPSFDKIQGAATPDTPLVYLATTPVGTVALVVRASQTLEVSDAATASEVSAVWLDGFNDDDLDALLVERQDGQVTGGYLPGQLGDHETLNASLAQALPRLGQALMAPLAAHLRGQGVTGVALAPAGRLSLLPLHAAHYVVDGLYRCFLDEFSVRFAPSAAALVAAHVEAQRRHAPLLLAGMGNPLPDLATGGWASQRAQAILARLPAAPSNQSLDQARQTLQAVAAASPQEIIRAGDLLIAAVRTLALGGAAIELVLAALEIAQRIPPSLDYAEAELRSVLDLLPGDGAWMAYGQDATRDALWQALPEATWLHLACHGQFNPQEPLDSALLLAAGSRITLRELLDRQQSAALAGLRLTFLSACQTAITDFNNVPDEAIGLPTGFLQAGIPAVVGTLWPVNDASTALLATRFYELHLHGDPVTGQPPQPPAAALQRAQRWLRDVTNAELAGYLDSHRRLKEASEQEQQRMSWALIKETRREVRRAVREGQGDARPYAAAYHWAPFVFYGAG